MNRKNTDSKVNNEKLKIQKMRPDLNEIEKNKIKIVCCNVGQISKKAIQKLQNHHGMENLLNLKGGATALKNHLE